MQRKPDTKPEKADHAATNVRLTYHVISLNYGDLATISCSSSYICGTVQSVTPDDTKRKCWYMLYQLTGLLQLIVVWSC